MKVTIQHIAKEMGLSRNTVAKALAGSEVVAYETRRSVIAKAEEMGYLKLSQNVRDEFTEVHPPVMPVRDSSVKTIAVLNRPEIAMFWNRIILGMSEELIRVNGKLQLVFIGEEDEKLNNIPADELSSVDAIVVLSVFSKEIIRKLERLGIPIVFFDMSYDDTKRPEKGDVILCEGAYSLACLTEKLIRQGLRDFGFIGDITYCTTVRDRYNGFTRALVDAGIKPDEGVMAVEHVTNRYYVASETRAAIDSFTHIPECIVCANDDIAWYAIDYLREKGFRVPEDVAVTGFDNSEEVSKQDPFLTTVRLANFRLGRRMIQQVFWRMEHEDFPQEITHVGVQIIYRRSSEKIIKR